MCGDFFSLDYKDKNIDSPRVIVSFPQRSSPKALIHNEMPFDQSFPA
jgi:hypothetical protein